MNESNIQLYQELEDLPQSIVKTILKLPEGIQKEFRVLYQQRRKTIFGVYFFHVLVGGSFGYLNNWVIQLVFWLTLFGGFGIGWLIALPILPFLVRKENKRIARKTLTELLVKHNYHLKKGERSTSSVYTSAFNPRNIRRDHDFDPSRITIDQLKTKDLFDFDLKTWAIISEAQFDYENAESERCLSVMSGIETAFVYWKRIGEHLQVAFAKPENLFKIDADILKKLEEDKVPPNILPFKGKQYYREPGLQGLYFKAENSITKSEKCKVWIYWDDDRKSFIRLEQIGKSQLTAYHGMLELEERFSDLLPASIR
ncbi:DUF4178 domain-containing protein [Sediminitomix flava]|uniref:Uncharacterized protein DUF4178 n=1 Tax=Sediminitomix flava TaxID=379075 RepID=A0A315ZEX0_SEDFL|nr:DUF4178 domain-containing protein [Sediminitomix flava]PWJ44136.1 uncharacterized protein DUF4178 [Sediminitomix flava]